MGSKTGKTKTEGGNRDRREMGLLSALHAADCQFALLQERWLGLLAVWLLTMLCFGQGSSMPYIEWQPLCVGSLVEWTAIVNVLQEKAIACYTTALKIKPNFPQVCWFSHSVGDIAAQHCDAFFSSSRSPSLTVSPLPRIRAHYIALLLVCLSCPSYWLLLFCRWTWQGFAVWYLICTWTLFGAR